MNNERLKKHLFDLFLSVECGCMLIQKHIITTIRLNVQNEHKSFVEGKFVCFRKRSSW